ncbi:MAG: ferredoxin family protein [Anaerolineae bacterium]|jgi:ferredoxin
MTYVITEPCIRDGACAEVCPVECIVPGPEDEGWPTYFIDPDTCIDCGACAPECPADAIFPDDEVPAEYEEWIDKNRAFFEEGPGYSAA